MSSHCHHQVPVSPRMERTKLHWLGWRLLGAIGVLALAGAADYLWHAVWLPRLSEGLAVARSEATECASEALKTITFWSNWSEAVLFLMSALAVAWLLFPEPYSRAR